MTEIGQASPKDLNALPLADQARFSNWKARIQELFPNIGTPTGGWFAFWVRSGMPGPPVSGSVATMGLTGGVAMNGASAPGVFYGQGNGGTSARLQAVGPVSGGSLTLAGPIVITLAVLVARFGAIIGRLIWNVLVRLAGSGGRITSSMWGRIPGWVKAALAVIGITEGQEIALDLFAPEAPGIPGLPALPDAGMGLDGLAIVGGWVANNIPFVRLSDGRLGAFSERKNRWKFWRPKKPIVLMPGGAPNLKSLLRADASLNRQSKRLSKMLARRAPKARRSKVVTLCPVCRTVPCKC